MFVKGLQIENVFSVITVVFITVKRVFFAGSYFSRFLRFCISRFIIFAVRRTAQIIIAHLCRRTYFKMTIFHVKAVINIIITRFCNRKEDELIKCGEVTFSIVVFTNSQTIRRFRGF